MAEIFGTRPPSSRYLRDEASFAPCTSIQMAQPAHAVTVVTHIAAPVVESEDDRFKRLKVFNAELFETVKLFVNKLDGKELAAAQGFRAKTKEALLRQKRAAAGRKRMRRFWSSTKDPPGDNFDTDEEGHAIDEELGEANLPQCYNEIKKLLVLEAHPMYAKALEEWSRKESRFYSRVERKQKLVAGLKNEIYQMIGFFSVFQGVLLTAVAQSSMLFCSNWWSPIFLSLVAFFVTVAGVVQKLVKIHEFQQTIQSDRHHLKIVVTRLSCLRGEGVDKFKFSKFPNKEAPKQTTYRFWTYFSFVVGTLLIFTAGFVLSHWRILCHSGLKKG